MKFLVALESTRAIALALLAMVWIKNHIVIDYLADIYTLSLLLCLISANLIKQLENPHLRPFLLLVSLCHLLRGGPVGP